MKKIAALGLDIGLKRVGVAGCDGLGLLATELATVYRTSFKNDVEEFKRIVADRQAEILVIGLPYSLDGSLGIQAKQVMKYAQRLSRALQLPIEYVDEKLTSIEAEEQLKSRKRYSSRNKGSIDKRAAAIILQQWLDEKKNK